MREKDWRVLYGEHELTYRVRDDGDGLDKYVFVKSNWVTETQARSLAKWRISRPLGMVR